jgi:hypothetical protein
MGKRNAAGTKSRYTVANSARVLRRPTSPPTAGRNPEASPPLSQLKSWRGAGQSLAKEKNERTARDARERELNDSSISLLIAFFKMLDCWDREKEHKC